MDNVKTPNTIYHNVTATRARCNQLNSHKSVVIWLTGVAHAIACASRKILQKYKVCSYLKHQYNKRNSLNQWFIVGVNH